MKNKIGAVLESYTLSMKKTIEEATKPKPLDGNSNSPRSPKIETRRSILSSEFDPGEEVDVEVKIADLLDES